MRGSSIRTAACAPANPVRIGVRVPHVALASRKLELHRRNGGTASAGAIRKYVNPGYTVYDIGANVGYVALSLAKRVGAKGRVFAFEPLPENLEQLRKNIALNNLANVSIENAAASDRAGRAVIRVAGNPSMASMAWHQQDPSAVEIAIETVAIDDLTDSGRLPMPQFVKIDVEGAEGLVLGGMQRTIATTRPVLFVECSDAGRDFSWKLLSELGYRCESAITGEAVNTYEAYRHSDFLWLPKAMCSGPNVPSRLDPSA